MRNRLPATRPPAPRVIHYVDPATPAELTFPLNPAELATVRRIRAVRERREAQLYATWKARQEAIAERDRKVRRFMAGFGAVIALALLAGIAVLGWFVFQALAAVSLGALAVPVVILLVAALGVGGHRCVTVVQHWH